MVNAHLGFCIFSRKFLCDTLPSSAEFSFEAGFTLHNCTIAISKADGGIFHVIVLRWFFVFNLAAIWPLPWFTVYSFQIALNCQLKAIDEGSWLNGNSTRKPSFGIIY